MSEGSGIQAPVLVMLLFLVAVQLLALAITPAITASGNRVFEDPESTANPFIYLALILGFTALLLLAMRMRQSWLIGGFILISIAASIYYVLVVFLPPHLALPPAIAMLLLLLIYPEWYIIDGFGVLICAGIASIFGVSMTVLPALMLLVVLAVYDAVSVYKTHHMISLAEGAIAIKAPLLFVVPRSRGYSFRRDQAVISKEGGRGAYFLGLGDAIIPTILVISANWSIDAVRYIGINLPAIGAMLGTYMGFFLLMATSRERPQAGLPFLNSGVILGMLAGCAVSGAWPL